MRLCVTCDIVDTMSVTVRYFSDHYFAPICLRSILRAHSKADQILEPYIARGLVTVVHWRFALNDTWFNSIQSVSMNNVLWKYGEYNKWMVFLDVDEFVVPRLAGEDSLLPLLSVSASKLRACVRAFVLLRVLYFCMCACAFV